MSRKPPCSSPSGSDWRVEMRDREVGLGLAGESLTALHLRTNLRSLGSALASGIQAFFYF